MGDSTDMTGHPVVEHPFDADTRVDPTGDGHSRGCCPIAGTRSAGSSTRVEPGPAQRRPDGEVLDEVQGRTRRRHPASLPALVDAAAPVVLELGLAGSMTVQLTTHVRGRPAPGWLACRVATATSLAATTRKTSRSGTARATSSLRRGNSVSVAG